MHCAELLFSFCIQLFNLFASVVISFGLMFLVGLLQHGNPVCLRRLGAGVVILLPRDNIRRFSASTNRCCTSRRVCTAAPPRTPFLWCCWICLPPARLSSCAVAFSLVVVMALPLIQIRCCSCYYLLCFLLGAAGAAACCSSSRLLTALGALELQLACLPFWSVS